MCHLRSCHKSDSDCSVQRWLHAAQAACQLLGNGVLSSKLTFAFVNYAHKIKCHLQKLDLCRNFLFWGILYLTIHGPQEKVCLSYSKAFEASLFHAHFSIFISLFSAVSSSVFLSYLFLLFH